LLGDDIGPEVVPECVKVMKAAAKKTGLQVEWQDPPIGKSATRSPPQCRARDARQYLKPKTRRN
jgi:isocitrate/isopropylmalate dehydrogenase